MLGHRAEVVHERGHDLCSDVVQDVAQNAGYPVERQDSYVLSKRYDKGKLAVHLHIGFRGVNAEAGDLCAVFERGVRNGHVHFGLKLSKWVEDRVAALVSRLRGDCSFPLNGSNRVQHAVSVNPGEFVEMPEPVISRGPPDLKRLQPLDTCPIFGVEVFDPVFRSLSSESLAGIANWKRCLAVGRRLAGEDRKLPHQMIEGRSHVLQTIPNQEAESEWRSFSKVNPEDVIAAVRLSLVGDKIRLSLEKTNDLSVERFQVLLCPVELQAHAS